MTDYNVIQYFFLEYTEIYFEILSEEEGFYLTLLAGTAEIPDIMPGLPLGQEFEVPVREFKNFKVMTVTCCNFIVRGLHYKYNITTKVGNTYENLRGFPPGEVYDAFTFDVNQWSQLQVFVSDSASEFDVSIECMSGKPEIFGFPLLPGRKYPLPPCSSFLVNSSNDESCSVCIYGQKRRATVSLLEERTWTRMRFVQARIQELRLEAVNNERVGPIILVTGSPNSGKSSFCHFLLNKSLDDGINPLYIDLDVRQNTNAIPGAVSLAKIGGRSSVAISLKSDSQNIWQLGNVKIDNNNIQLYYLLIQKMGELLCPNQKASSRTRYSSAVIDMCGSLGKDISTFNHVMKQFNVDLVVVIGDFNYYGVDSAFKNKEFVFIPKPQYIEPRDEISEMKILEITLQIYFYGIINKPARPSVFEAKFADFNIYRIVNAAPGRNATTAGIENFRIESVECDRSVENYVLGVSSAENADAVLPLTEIEYFVCFSRVDTERKTVTVLSLASDLLHNKILLIGDIRLT